MLITSDGQSHWKIKEERTNDYMWLQRLMDGKVQERSSRRTAAGFERGGSGQGGTANFYTAGLIGFFPTGPTRQKAWDHNRDEWTIWICTLAFQNLGSLIDFSIELNYKQFNETMTSNATKWWWAHKTKSVKMCFASRIRERLSV